MNNNNFPELKLSPVNVKGKDLLTAQLIYSINLFKMEQFVRMSNIKEYLSNCITKTVKRAELDSKYFGQQ